MSTAPSTNTADPFKRIRYWLYFTCAMIGAMAIIGAITRLTESGLSMTEWRPVTGWLPPLTEEEWQRQYNLYKQSPEFKHKHNWMALADFKQIFFWEWLHRLWGRIIGLVYILPLAWFWVRRQLPTNYKKFFLFVLLLGGFQGFIGWWMVKSGLIDRPSVSHFRLATHLGIALILFALLWSAALKLRPVPPRLPISKSRGLKPAIIAGMALLALTIVWGAFVAGTDAGLIYNSFPTMDGRWLPHGTLTFSTFINDPGWIQFTHRWLAILTGLYLIGLSWRLKDYWLGGMVIIQVSLGILTLLSQVDITLATLHQAGAIVLLALMVSSLVAVFEQSKHPEQGQTPA